MSKLALENFNPPEYAPCTVFNGPEVKEADRQRIQADIADFLKKGGKIKAADNAPSSEKVRFNNVEIKPKKNLAAVPDKDPIEIKFNRHLGLHVAKYKGKKVGQFYSETAARLEVNHHIQKLEKK